MSLQEFVPIVYQLLDLDIMPRSEFHSLAGREAGSHAALHLLTDLLVSN